MSSSIMFRYCHQQVLVLLISLWTTSKIVVAEDEEQPSYYDYYDDNLSADASDDFFKRRPVDTTGWLEGFQSGLLVFVSCLFVVVFILHTVLQPQYMMMYYMQDYLDEGTAILGTALESRDATTGENRYLVKVMYECREHMYHNNHKLRFRFPRAYQDKKFVQEFEFHRFVPSGQAIPILLPLGRITPRSGCPKEVIEEILNELALRRQRRMIVLGVGSVISLILFGFCIARVVYMPDSSAGAATLFVSLIVIEVVSFLYCANEFLKKKRKDFDSAVPLPTSEQEAQQTKEHVDTDPKEAYLPPKSPGPL